MKVRFKHVLILATLLILGIVVFTNKKTEKPVACNPVDFSGEIDPGQKTAYFEGQEVKIPEIAFANNIPPVLGVSNEERWIEVDLSEQKLKAWEGSTLYLESLVSTGLPWTPTPTGEFRIWLKLRATKMEGGMGRYYYFLPNVPYVMFFENDSTPAFRGFSLHGTYWHNDFGKVHSHGCVNLPTQTAGKLFWWVSAKNDSNSGTRIVIHE